MPTYDYRCSNCGHELEAFQAMSEDPLTDCPNCGTPKLRRLISGGTGVIFRGGGFYVTDSRATANGKRKAEKTAAVGDSGSDSGSSSGSSADTGTGSTSGATESSPSPPGSGAKGSADKPATKPQNTARKGNRDRKAS